jgi:hypothetical protein
LDSGCDNFQAKWVQYWLNDSDRSLMIEIRFYESEEAAGSDYEDYSDLLFAERSNTSEYTVN